MSIISNGIKRSNHHESEYPSDDHSPAILGQKSGQTNESNTLVTLEEEKAKAREGNSRVKDALVDILSQPDP